MIVRKDATFNECQQEDSCNPKFLISLMVSRDTSHLFPGTVRIPPVVEALISLASASYMAVALMKPQTKTEYCLLVALFQRSLGILYQWVFKEVQERARYRKQSQVWASWQIGTFSVYKIILVAHPEEVHLLLFAVASNHF